MNLTARRALVALLLALGLAGAAGLATACSGYHNAVVPASAQPTDDWVEGCVDDNNLRVDDIFCDSPHAHYYPVWAPIGPSYYMPAYGRPLFGGGWSRRRPAGVTVNNTIVHVNSGGGSVSRNGTGNGIGSGTRVGGRTTSSAPTSQASSGTTKRSTGRSSPSSARPRPRSTLSGG